MQNEESLISIKPLYNCKWYKRLYYMFYNSWHILKAKKDTVTVIYQCYKEDEPSSELIICPYVPYISHHITQNKEKDNAE